MAFGKIHERWGVDPGIYFTDDVIAFNVRAGLLVAMAQDARETAQDGPGATQEPGVATRPGKIVTDLEEQMRAYVDR